MADNSTEPSRHSRDFERVVVWVSALSLAITAGLLASLKQINPTVIIEFGALSVIAFFAAGTLTLVVLRFLLRRADTENPAKLRRQWLLLFLIAGFGTVFSLIGFAIKNVSLQHQIDVIVGTGFAVIVLTFIGWFCWRIVRFLEANDEKQIQRENEQREEQ